MAKAFGEVSKHLSSATARVVLSAKHASTSTSCGVVASPAKLIDNRSKCYKQLGDLSDPRNSGVLTDEEYLRKKEAIVITLKKF